MIATNLVVGAKVGDPDSTLPPQLLPATADREDSHTLPTRTHTSEDLETAHVEAEHVVAELHAHRC